MKKDDVQSKKRGRPATGTNLAIGVRMPDDEIAMVDEWRSKQLDIPTRPEAIRRLVKLALTKGRRGKG